MFDGGVEECFFHGRVRVEFTLDLCEDPLLLLIGTIACGLELRKEVFHHRMILFQELGRVQVIPFLSRTAPLMLRRLSGPVPAA